MTTTTVIGPVTVGDIARSVSNITKHTFSASSGAFNIQLGVTGGSQQTPSKLVLRYAPLMDSVTADAETVRGAGPASFTLETYYVPGTTRYFTTDIEGCRGRYLLLWLEEPLMSTSASVTVKITEY